MSTHNSPLQLWPEDLALLSRKEIETQADRLIVKYKHLLSSEAIPFSESSSLLLKQLYLPLANWILQKNNSQIVLGINGAQGSGKTTFSKILKLVLEEQFNSSVVILSLDDFYLSKLERNKLSRTVHPLLSTRGVPGTHDVAAITAVLNDFKYNNLPTTIPVFNKAIDDQKDKSSWKTITTKPDIILFEGWCVGAIAEDDAGLNADINSLEKKFDKNRHWRTYVNQQLKLQYSDLFSRIDHLIMLKAPSFEKILQWRILQEEKLRATNMPLDQKCMNQQQITRFIMFFERITRHMLKEIPSRASFTLEIDDEHQISVCHHRP